MPRLACHNALATTRLPRRAHRARPSRVRRRTRGACDPPSACTDVGWDPPTDAHLAIELRGGVGTEAHREYCDTAARLPNCDLSPLGRVMRCGWSVTPDCRRRGKNAGVGCLTNAEAERRNGGANRARNARGASEARARRESGEGGEGVGECASARVEEPEAPGGAKPRAGLRRRHGGWCRRVSARRAACGSSARRARVLRRSLTESELTPCARACGELTAADTLRTLR